MAKPEQQPVDDVETYALSSGWGPQRLVTWVTAFLLDRPPVRDRSDWFTAWDRSHRQAALLDAARDVFGSGK